MPLELTDDEWFARLSRRRQDQQATGRRLWEYYDNEQPLAYIAKILAEQGDRFPAMKVNWSGLVVDSIEERLDVEGFRVGADASGLDDDLVQVWQDNDLDEASGEGHIASMVAKQSFIMVGPHPDDLSKPLVTVEYPDQVAVEVDPVSRRPRAALKMWASDTELGLLNMAELHLPGRLVTYELGKKVDEQAQPWAKALEQHQTSPMVGVVPMLNRPRRWVGRSELDAIIPLVDGCNQTATNMMAALEHHALPRRWALNVAEQDFQDKDGNPVPAWKIATGAIWAIPRVDDDTGVLGEQAQPKVGQFSAADLQNFHGSLRTLAIMAASLYGLPPHYMGLAGDNPASADAIRAAESRLVKRAERRQRTFGGAWERAMRIALAIMGRDPSEANRIETVWRDAATPTRAAQADAAVKLKQADIIDDVQAQEDAGYTRAQREAMAARRDKQTGQTERIVAGIRGLNLPGQTGQPAPGQPPVPQPGQIPPGSVNGGAPAAGR